MATGGSTRCSRSQGLTCDLKTVWETMRRRGGLSTSRTRLIRSGRRHEGQVRVAEPNRRWASDITSIRAWDGRKGRLAIMIDCADRMVLAWRFATRITAEDLAEMLREAIFRRFGETRAHAQGDRVSQRQRAGIHVASVPAVRASHGAHPLPYAPAESAVEWISRGLLRQLQTGLCVSGASRHSGSGAAAGAGVDRP